MLSKRLAGAMLIGLLVGFHAGHPSAAQGGRATVEVSFDCPSVPWSCGGGSLSTHWQLYQAVCDNSGCEWRWRKRLSDGATFELLGLDQYRLYLGPDGPSDSIYDCSTLLRSTPSEAVVEWYHDCDRWPEVCRGLAHWQVYECEGEDCEWRYELTQDCLYLYMPVTAGRRYLLRWGWRGGLVVPSATPTVRPPPTATRTATRTPTRRPSATAAPSATATASATALPGDPIPRPVSPTPGGGEPIGPPPTGPPPAPLSLPWLVITRQ